MTYSEQKIANKWRKATGDDSLRVYRRHGWTYFLGSKEACELLSCEFKGFASEISHSEKHGWFFKLNPKSVVWE
jgi:hypothetical protein